MKVMDCDEGIDVEAASESSKLLKNNECEQCKKLGKRLEMVEGRKREAESSLQEFNMLRIQYATELDDLKAAYEMKDDECQQLHHKLDEFLNDPHVAPKLSTIAQTRIHNLGKQIKELETENDYIHGEYVKQRDMRQFEAERCKTIESETKLLKTRTEQQAAAYKSLKRSFKQRLLDLDQIYKDKDEEIEKLGSDVGITLQLFSKVLNSLEFKNNEIKQEIQQYLDDVIYANDNL